MPRLPAWLRAVLDRRALAKRIAAEQAFSVCEYCGDCQPERGYCPGCCVR